MRTATVGPAHSGSHKRGVGWLPGGLACQHPEGHARPGQPAAADRVEDVAGTVSSAPLPMGAQPDGLLMSSSGHTRARKIRYSRHLVDGFLPSHQERYSERLQPQVR